MIKHLMAAPLVGLFSALALTAPAAAASLETLFDRYRTAPVDGIYHCAVLSGSVVDFNENTGEAEASIGTIGNLTLTLRTEDSVRVAELAGINAFGLFPVLRTSSIEENEFLNVPVGGRSFLMGVSLKLYQDGRAWFHISMPTTAVMQLLQCRSVQ